MTQVIEIIGNNGNTRFSVPTRPRLSPEALFRLSNFGTGGVQGYQPRNESFSKRLRGNILFNELPENDEVNLSFVWLGKGRVKFSEVPEMLGAQGLRPATLREALSLGREARLAQTRTELYEVYTKYFIDNPSILYIIGSRDLITVKNQELSFQDNLEEVKARNSELLTNKYYWILAAEL